MDALCRRNGFFTDRLSGRKVGTQPLGVQSASVETESRYQNFCSENVIKSWKGMEKEEK